MGLESECNFGIGLGSEAHPNPIQKNLWLRQEKCVEMRLFVLYVFDLFWGGRSEKLYDLIISKRHVGFSHICGKIKDSA